MLLALAGLPGNMQNQELVKLIAAQEIQARGACMEYECNQGDHNYLGMSHNNSYKTYQPYQALSRI